MQTTLTAAKAKLRWACRRGMLELDLMFGHYLDNNYDGLDPAEKALFVDLLGCHDQELFNWLMGKTPAPPQFSPLVQAIRESRAQAKSESACTPLKSV
jgi:antitoxin CptB